LKDDPHFQKKVMPQAAPDQRLQYLRYQWYDKNNFSSYKVSAFFHARSRAIKGGMLGSYEKPEKWAPQQWSRNKYGNKGVFPTKDWWSSIPSNYLGTISGEYDSFPHKNKVQ